MISEYQILSDTMEMCSYNGNHKLVATCQCGENTICYNCGYGYENCPCACQKEQIKVEQIIEDAINEVING